jgi:hypothetical protein
MRQPYVALLLFFALACLGNAPYNAPGPRSVFNLLCTGQVNGDDRPEYINLRAIDLDDSRLQITVDYGLRNPRSTLGLSQTNGIGYRLDKGAVTVIRPQTNDDKATFLISFFGLLPGKHLITIGHAQRSGDMDLSQDYCFTTPGHFDLHANTYL